MEVSAKLALLRGAVARYGLGGIRLRGVDWFAWATGGRSSVVALTSERGVAEVLVGPTGAWVVTDAIEAPRLRDEELPAGFVLVEHPWADAAERETCVAALCPGPLASDRPVPGEGPLPPDVVEARWHLLPPEVDRLRALCADASVAVTDVLHAARRDWTEHALAGHAAEALWSRGIEPGVLLVAGEARLPKYRHPIPTGATLGGAAMLVVCGRRGGLWANLTRFVYFRAPTPDERARHDAVAAVEAVALAASRPGQPLGGVFRAMRRAYAAAGHPAEETKHHQGGLTGYLPREVVATADTQVVLPATCALAWNPSLPGAKIEDTVLASPAGLEVLTVDPRWPARTVGGRARPDVLVR